jgi:hypothetical protein
MTERETDKKAQTPDQPKPSSELKRLDALVGEWRTEWYVTSDDGKPLTLHGVDTYEWMPGEFFLVHHTYVRMGNYDYNVMQVIGNYDTSSQTYSTHSFDSKGVEMSMHARVNDDNSWMFEGEKQRTRLVLSDDGQSMTYHWEQLNDGSDWQPWMEMQLTKET